MPFHPSSSTTHNDSRSLHSVLTISVIYPVKLNIPFFCMCSALVIMLWSRAKYHAVYPTSLKSFPLIPAETSFRGSPPYHPISPSSIAPLTSRNRSPRRPPKPCCLDKSIPCAHKTMTLHTMTPSTTFTNNFCACQSSPFTDIRLICSVFVEFITSFFHVLTCFNGCVAAMDARLGFGTRH